VNVKEIVKSAARGAASIVVLPLLASFAVRRMVLGRDRALQNSTQLLALLPGLAGQYLRRAFLARTIAACHNTVVVEFGTTISRAGTRLDAYAYIGPGCHLGLVHVERDVMLAAGVHVPSGSHTHLFDDLSRPIREQSHAERQVRIGAGSWIGAAAVVMADVGRESVVGAGSVVTRPLPPHCIAVGTPARVVRFRSGQPAQAI
jgi:acetyltransferase-like isoleucine patch superfamily enzyme